MRNCLERIESAKLRRSAVVFGAHTPCYNHLASEARSLKLSFLALQSLAASGLLASNLAWQFPSQPLASLVTACSLRSD